MNKQRLNSGEKKKFKQKKHVIWGDLFRGKGRDSFRRDQSFHLRTLLLFTFLWVSYRTFIYTVKCVQKWFCDEKLVT